MKNTFPLLLLFVTFLHSRGATPTVFFNLGDFTTAAVAYKQVLIVPKSTPRVEGAQLIGSDQIQKVTDSSGQFYVTNMVQGTYRVTFTNRFIPTIFEVTIPDTNAVINAKDYTSSGTNAPSNLAAYTQAQADRLFMLKTNSTVSNYGMSNTFTRPRIFISPGATNNPGSSNYVLVLTNVATGEVDFRASPSSVSAATNGTSIVSAATNINLVAGANVTITGTNSNGNVSFGISSTSSAGGETNTASNIGSGVGVFAGKSSLDLQFMGPTNSDASLLIYSNSSAVFIGATNNLFTATNVAALKALSTTNRLIYLSSYWGTNSARPTDGAEGFLEAKVKSAGPYTANDGTVFQSDSHTNLVFVRVGYPYEKLNICWFGVVNQNGDTTGIEPTADDAIARAQAARQDGAAIYIPGNVGLGITNQITVTNESGFTLLGDNVGDSNNGFPYPASALFWVGTNGASTMLHLVNVHGFRIKGIHFEGSTPRLTYPWTNGASRAINVDQTVGGALITHNGIIEDCSFRNRDTNVVDWQAITFSDLSANNVERMVVEHCTIQGTGTGGNWSNNITGGAGIVVGSSANVKNIMLRNNTFSALATNHFVLGGDVLIKSGLGTAPRVANYIYGTVASVVIEDFRDEAGLKFLIGTNCANIELRKCQMATGGHQTNEPIIEFNSTATLIMINNEWDRSPAITNQIIYTSIGGFSPAIISHGNKYPQVPLGEIGFHYFVGGGESSGDWLEGPDSLSFTLSPQVSYYASNFTTVSNMISWISGNIQVGQPSSRVFIGTNSIASTDFGVFGRQSAGVRIQYSDTALDPRMIFYAEGASAVNTRGEMYSIGPASTTSLKLYGGPNSNSTNEYIQLVTEASQNRLNFWGLPLGIRNIAAGENSIQINTNRAMTLTGTEATINANVIGNSNVTWNSTSQFNGLADHTNTTRFRAGMTNEVGFITKSTTVAAGGIVDIALADHFTFTMSGTTNITISNSLAVASNHRKKVTIVVANSGGGTLTWTNSSGTDSLFWSGGTGPSQFTNVSTVYRVECSSVTNLGWVDTAATSTGGGGGEANTMSSLGGLSIVGTKSGVDLPIHGVDSTQFLTNAGVVSIVAGAPLTNTVHQSQTNDGVIYVSPTGKIGVQTNDPQALVDIQGTNSGNGYLLRVGSGNVTGAKSTNTFLVKSNGLVSIGREPISGYDLSVEGLIYSSSSYIGSGGAFQSFSSGSKLLMQGGGGGSGDIGLFTGTGTKKDIEIGGLTPASTNIHITGLDGSVILRTNVYVPNGGVDAMSMTATNGMTNNGTYSTKVFIGGTNGVVDIALADFFTFDMGSTTNLTITNSASIATGYRKTTVIEITNHSTGTLTWTNSAGTESLKWHAGMTPVIGSNRMDLVTVVSSSTTNTGWHSGYEMDDSEQQIYPVSNNTNFVVDVSIADRFLILATNQVHLAAPTNLVRKSFQVFLFQDGTGGYNVSCNTNYWKFSSNSVPVNTTNANAKDVFTFSTLPYNTNIAGTALHSF